MIFEKISSRRPYQKSGRHASPEVRRGAGTCEAPCILGRVLDSTFMQARVRLSCRHSLGVGNMPELVGDRSCLRSSKDFFATMRVSITWHAPSLSLFSPTCTVSPLTRLTHTGRVRSLCACHVCIALPKFVGERSSLTFSRFFCNNASLSNVDF